MPDLSSSPCLPDEGLEWVNQDDPVATGAVLQLLPADHTIDGSRTMSVPTRAATALLDHSAPTNRPRDTRDFPLLNVPGLGLDTIRVRGRIHSSDMPYWRKRGCIDLRTGEEVEHLTGEYAALTDQIFLNVREYPGGVYAALEFSVPTYLRKHNLQPASLDEAQHAVTALHQQAVALVEWAVSPEDLQVSRLDIVRQFSGITHQGALFEAITQTPCSRLSISSEYRHPNTCRLETIVRGVKDRWRANLYDKQAEMHTRSRQTAEATNTALREAALYAEGVVRYEAQLRRPALRDLGVHQMGDLPALQRALQQHARDLFRRSGYDTSTGGTDKVVAAMRRMRSTPSDYKHVEKMLGYLVRVALGEPPGMGRDATAGAAKLAARYGLTPADMRGGGGAHVRLDYDVAAERPVERREPPCTRTSSRVGSAVARVAVCG